MLTPYQEQWFAHNGKEVWIHGYRHTLSVKRSDAIYPYAHTVVRVHAVPVNHETRYYRDTRQALGDDWSIDVLGSDEITPCVMYQLGWHVEDEASL